MELYGKPIEMSDMQWPKIMVECIVQQGVINRKVVWLGAIFVQDHGGAIASSCRAFAGRPSNWLLVRIGKDSVFGRRSSIGC